MVQKQAQRVVGLGVACRLIRYRYRRRYRYRYRRGIEPTNPSAKLLADRLATLSVLRQHGHTTIEQCLLLAVVVCGQRIAHQQARPEAQRTPAPSLVRFQTTGVDPRSSLCRSSAMFSAMACDACLRCAPTMRTGVDPSRYAVLSHARSRARPSRQTRWPHARRRAAHDRMA
jgi:hypothetical protein